MEFFKLFGIAMIILAAAILYDVISSRLEQRRLKNEVVPPFSPTPELVKHSVNIVNTISGAAEASVLDVMPIRVLSGSNSGLPYFAFPTLMSPTRTADRRKVEIALTQLLINFILVPNGRSSVGFLYDWREPESGLFYLEIRYAITRAENDVLAKTIIFEQGQKLRNQISKVAFKAVDPELIEELKKCK